MKVSVNTISFEKQMDNIVNYSLGFLEGAQIGKTELLKNLGEGTIKALGAYIDTSAKLNQAALHHVYEWYQTGSPAARLFDLTYTVTNSGLSMGANLKQSRTLSQDSNTPFYDKAKIMEKGIPVNIKPKGNGVLAFTDAGETVFTKKPIFIKNPGGTQVRGSFEQIIDEFVLRYFKQSFLKACGLFDYISKPTLFKENISAGSKVGKAKGKDVGYKWMANAKIGVE